MPMMSDSTAARFCSTPADRRLRGVPGSAITGRALSLVAQVRVAAWDRVLRDPKSVQLATLLSHCARGKDTEFGQKHRLGGVRSVLDYRERVPLRTYADFEPMLLRMRHGQRNVLHPDFIKYYGCSSGTSSTAALNKYLPISEEQIRWQQKSGFDLLARYTVLSGDKTLLGGFSLQLMPPAVVRKEGPVGITSNPGLMLLKMPRVSRRNVLPKPPLRDIEDYNRKLDAIADAYLDYDVRAMSGTTCWFPNLFDRVLLAARRRGMPARVVHDVWPNLRVLFGGGVHAGPYRDVITERVGRAIPLMDNYNATEGGIFAVTDNFDAPGMCMIPDRGVFFEFVPREEHGRPDARRYALWEVEPGGEYSVAVTTCSGLYGYYMGDFVRFTGVFPHRIEFTGRASGMLSVTQELVTYLEIERAVAHALSETNSAVVDFSCGADVGVSRTAKGRYALFVEFTREPKDPAAFAAAFDAELKQQNRVYREHRNNEVAILPPEVVTLPPGALRRFVELIGRNGPQQKFPHIVDDKQRDVLRGLSSAGTSQ
jgi:hypothetical protein